MRAALIAAVFGALAVTALATAASTRTAETLPLRAVFAVNWARDDCPSGTDSTTSCYLNKGRGVVSGLGAVTEKYNLLVVKTDANCWGWRFTGRFAVTSKGGLNLAAHSTGCFSPTQTEGSLLFTVTGGSGVYGGASGAGTLRSGGTNETGPGQGTAVDTWIGTLEVPGLSFDVTAPTLQRVAGKTARAPNGMKRVRVRYIAPTAKDDVDGILPVLCRPPSGSLFKAGTTIVRCSATDKSGNTAQTQFAVRVKPR